MKYLSYICNMNFRNIPLSFIYFIIITSVLISIPHIFEFGEDESNAAEISYTYKLANHHKDTIITDLRLLTNIIIQKDTLHLKQYITNTSKNTQIHTHIGFGILYGFIVFIYIIFFAILIGFGELKYIYPIGCRYLPTVSKTFYYTVNVKLRTIKVYRQSFIILDNESTYQLGSNENLSNKMIEISKELDEKYMSYDFQELKNWKK